MSLGSKTIITHSGKFHTDEVLAVGMLMYLYPLSNVIRTRDTDIINDESLDSIVVDVGRIYDPDKHMFDHHQDTFNDTFDCDSSIPLSSCGLIYRHFGKKLLDSFVRGGRYATVIDIDSLYKTIYYKFIIAIDANDNGVSQYNDRVKKAYNSNISLVETICKLNNMNHSDDVLQMKSFKKAVQLAWDVFKIYLKDAIEASGIYEKDLMIIRKAFDTRHEYSHNRNILVIHEECHNRMKCILEIEKERGMKGVMKFIVYPDIETGDWKLRAISWGFKNRVDIGDFPNLDGVKFIHKNKFIARVESKYDAIRLAKMSLI